MKECTRVRRRIRWWQHFSSGLESHLNAEQLFFHGRSANFDAGVWNVPIGTVDQCPEQWGVLLLSFLLKTHQTNPYGNYQRNLECRVRPCLATYLLMKSGRLIYENELSDTDMRLHEACSMLLKWIPTALSRGKFLYSDEWLVYLSSLIRNAVLGQTESLLHDSHVRPLIHVMIWKSVTVSHIICRNYQWCFIHWQLTSWGFM